MTWELTPTLADLSTLVTNITQHTRPTTQVEVTQALNVGYFKAVRALASVRSEYFLTYLDPFTVTSGSREIDLSAIEPPFWRPVRLLVGAGGATPSRRFVFRALASRGFEDAELSTLGGDVFYYDILEGRFPGTTLTATSGTTGTATVASTAGLAIGQPIDIPGRGTQSGLVVTHQAVITSLTSTVISFSPASSTVQNGDTIIPYRRRILQVAPTPAETVSGRMYYLYRPRRLSDTDDRIDPILAEHRDMLIAFAVGHLLQAVDESAALLWTQQAETMRAELMADCDPLSGQNTVALGSDLTGLGDW